MKLSPAQENILLELAEPNQNPENEWTVPGKWVRSLELMRDRGGLVKFVDRFGGREAWTLTEAGRLRVAEIRKRDCPAEA